MSTKSSLACGPNFHLYHDMLVEDHVCLEIEGAQFEASYGRVMVPIPVHVWEVIRRYPGVDLQLADKTDAELRQYVEQMVDDRLKRHHESAQNTKPIMALSGALVFGPIDEPHEVQLATGLDHYTRLREHQRQIQRAVTELEQANRRI